MMRLISMSVDIQPFNKHLFLSGVQTCYCISLDKQTSAEQTSCVVSQLCFVRVITLILNLFSLSERRTFWDLMKGVCHVKGAFMCTFFLLL